MDNQHNEFELPAVQVLSLMDTTGQQREAMAMEIISQIEEGEVDPLKVHVYLKCMQDIIDLLLDTRVSKMSPVYKALVLAEAEKHGKKFEYHNAEFKIGETGTKYDYSQCGDAALLEQMDVHEAMGKAIKKRQEFLKTFPDEGLETRVGDELVTFYPPSKSSTTAVIVSLQK